MFRAVTMLSGLLCACCVGHAADEGGLSPSSMLSAAALAEKNGRVLVIHTDSNQPERMLAGTTHGGLWRSKDAGHTWVLASIEMHKLPVTAISAEPHNPDVIYAGTGDGRRGGHASTGRGIYKSMDGGMSWHLLQLTDPGLVDERWSHVLSIAVSTDGVVLAATSDKKRNGYIFRSPDGGENWGLFPVYDGSRIGKSNLVHKVRFDPGNPKLAIFMDDYANVTYSGDAGISWSVVKKSSSTCK